ncbi:hypothetical protein PHYSODRAFT_252155 [Phytophthora sojae]|uniref:Uncharacterized protein n=1 Tax=Phytophthora sojae (strain P6497) TaxID=1094619 RepID=G4ZBB1_PHYSP|nr:hypothetical protein PHYSODRAFT_252155 [Phytophthora sojae]EGZ22707.1 hypothetical protein PHYSODRAFT_252155 [Phytophthora sojae]|eukprot:XP_009525424.1 hypothetical protein PHYSODRAFT_252155 [Phytophthora sojae]
MITTPIALVQYSQRPPTIRGSKRKAEQMNVATNGEPTAKCPYLGKCQYKTGKCFNERTLKRNGDAHSLCEEHRIKQNLNQRRSDRKYQKVHAIRCRHRRALLKKQVSMIMAQQLFLGQQQQKTFVTPLSQCNASHMISTNSNCDPVTASASTPANVARRFQVLQPSSAFVLDSQNNIGSSLVLSFSNAEATELSPITSVNDEFTPSGIDNFTPYLFQRAPDVQSLAVQQFVESDESSSVGDNLGYVPIGSSLGDKHPCTWSNDDIELLQTILLA